MNETEHRSVINGRTSPSTEELSQITDSNNHNNEDMESLREELVAADERNVLLSAEFKRLQMSLKKSNERLIAEKTTFKRNLGNLAENLNAFESGLRAEQRSISLALSRKENEIKARDEMIKSLQTELYSVRRCSECMSLVSSNPDHIIPDNNGLHRIDPKQHSQAPAMLQPLSLDLTTRPTKNSRKQVFAHHHRNNLSDLSPVVEESETPTIDRQQYECIKERLPNITDETDKLTNGCEVADTSTTNAEDNQHGIQPLQAIKSKLPSKNTAPSLYDDYVDIESDRLIDTAEEEAETSTRDDQMVGSQCNTCVEVVSDDVEPLLDFEEPNITIEKVADVETKKDENNDINIESDSESTGNDLCSNQLDSHIQESVISVEEDNSLSTAPNSLCDTTQDCDSVTITDRENCDDYATTSVERPTAITDADDIDSPEATPEVEPSQAGTIQQAGVPREESVTKGIKQPECKNDDVDNVGSRLLNDKMLHELNRNHEETVQLSTQHNHINEETNSEGSGNSGEVGSHEGSIECEANQSNKKSKTGDKGLDDYDVIELDDGGSSNTKNHNANKQKGNSKKKKNKNKRKNKAKK